MALKATQVKVWAASIEDRPGGLAEKLEPLAAAGANLDFVIARRAPDKPGTGVVFAAPIAGDKAVKAAEAAGFTAAPSLHSVRIEAPDQPGLGAKLTRKLADAGVNLRGLSAAAVGRQCVCYLAFDTAEAAAKAMNIAKELS